MHTTTDALHIVTMLCYNEDNISSENLPTSSDLRESLSDKQESRILEERCKLSRCTIIQYLSLHSHEKITEMLV